MTTTTDAPMKFTIRGPEDLVALAPIVLGFTPSDSVVLEGLVGARPFHARIDLPARADLDRATAADLAGALVDPATRQGVTGVALLFYTEDPDAASRAWRALRGHCARRGVEILDALRVVPGRYHPLRGERTVRDRGVPVDLESHRFTAEAVAAGMVTRSSREDLATTLRPDPVAQAEVTRHIAAASTTPAHDPGAAEWVLGFVGDHVADGTPADVEDLARLLPHLTSPATCAAIVGAVTGGTAQPHVEFWSDATRRAPERWVAGPASMLAWSAWRAGHGAMAWLAVDRCREVDPECPWAELVATALEEALPPECADVLVQEADVVDDHDH